jgi:hypothetical protein
MNLNRQYLNACFLVMGLDISIMYMALKTLTAANPFHNNFSEHILPSMAGNSTVATGYCRPFFSHRDASMARGK